MSAEVGSVPADTAVIAFADGLPGFEHQRRFVLLSGPSFEPFTILRGLGPDAPSFATIDPRTIVPEYAPRLGPQDLARLDATAGDTLVWLAIVSLDPSGEATANLRAPVVISPASLRGIQLIDINADAGSDAPAPQYRFDHPLRAA
ncbi:MAG TPA: flagellar assembly protein FliW [Vicinamibacterales bacterium]|nr:flagellar assembly protein FliW [Vicinamibacterales bacterium]